MPRAISTVALISWALFVKNERRNWPSKRPIKDILNSVRPNTNTIRLQYSYFPIPPSPIDTTRLFAEMVRQRIKSSKKLTKMDIIYCLKRSIF